eukprot:scaffold12214_cov33-Attheya_sp.AAC.2
MTSVSEVMRTKLECVSHSGHPFSSRTDPSFPCLSSHNNQRYTKKSRTESMIPYHVADEDAAVKVLAMDDGSLDQIEFEISGDPRPLQRPRFVRMLRSLGCSYPLMYNLSRRIINNFKAAAREVLLLQPGDRTVFSNQDYYLEMDCSFIIKRPRSHFNMDGSLRKDALCFLLVSDVDNMGKLVLDALEGILYDPNNDKRIVNLRLVKSYPCCWVPAGVWSDVDKSMCGVDPTSCFIRFRNKTI